MKTNIFISTVVSLMLLVSATVWEGVTDVVSKGDLPGNYSVATNSFPKNSVVDITNLENGKIVRALVVSGLETTGLLATLSRNAANSIELRDNSTCRIRITQPSDDIVFSHFKLGPIAAPSPVSEPDAISENNISGLNNSADYPSAKRAVTGTAAETGMAQASAQTVTDIIPKDAAAETSAKTVTVAKPAAAEKPAIRETAGAITTAKAAEKNSTEKTPAVKPPKDAAAEASVQIITERYTNTVVEPVEPVAAAAATTTVQPVSQPAVDNTPELVSTSGNLSIIPSEERIPEAVNQLVIAPENIAPPLKTNNASSSFSSSPVTSDFSPFQVPLISRLEQGKYYVQVAAYRRVEHVEDEISRIGTIYPLAVQNVGSDTNPMFRILLGPLNQGESGAMLQRFKGIGYKDAFIRYN
jgi:hypothetical protein